MHKDEEHIIDWILRKTDHHRQQSHFNEKKRASSFERRKIKLDNQIFLCLNCKHTWSKVPRATDSNGWRLYPKGNVPTIGKKRKDCPNCKKRSNNE
jgi:rubrerythrin